MRQNPKIALIASLVAVVCFVAPAASAVGLLGLNVIKDPPNDTILNVNLKPVVDLLPKEAASTMAPASTTTRAPASTTTRAPKIGTRVSDAGGRTCGVVQVTHTGLIVAGRPTKPGDWPWHVALFRLRTSGSEQKYICGGSLLTETRVLTAAHCVIENGESVLAERLFAVVGKYNLAGGDIGSQERGVFEVVLHPEFDSVILENDIAMLKLAQKVKYTMYVQPICLWNRNNINKTEIANKLGTVVGWGFTENDTPATELMKATMPVKDDLVCIRSDPLFYTKFLTDTTYCAGYANGTSACNGDSGGGMYFADENNRWHLRGIVSLSVARRDKNLCDPNYYTIFTDVAQYFDFINKNIGSGNTV